MEGTGNSEILLVYLIGTIGMLLLAGGLFFFFIAYQKRLLQKQLELNRVVQNQQEEIIKNTIQSQENERKRIARDLHDEVGAMLSVVKLTVGRIEKKAEGGKAKELATETKTYLDDVILQVRRISRSLLPPSLEKLGLYFALEELANWVNKSDQLAIECWKSGEQFRFDSKQELAVFRIVQELVNNAIKHAEASHILIDIRFAKQLVAVVVADDGKGFSPEEKMQTGLGLRNLESRSEMANAKFKMKSSPGKGTRAIIALQINE
ncbi:Histidine kinase-, DNA gyrase B-, and HSP90-like ATPase [Draconibacterium orientale]|uniref:histidine kinase n=1 Tax=Draconibacterium orientale TaxID=1168034 RepID=X5DXZ3_9BACT|nr:sensor histidine kinase [Draconibacterium orientale]AHW60110.1 histidine kinase [Draconibacterium orientale]SET61713.1 Histidine kinase-, DNA gyrase B-, and HSP90-like ATPase [Draconibacterium orientale]